MDTLPFYLQVSQQNRTVVFMNSQFPTLHLTISWMNQSGEFDIHMSRELSNGSKLYSSIAKFTEADLKRFSEWLELNFEPQLISILSSFLIRSKPIRPGWLRRRGYVILWVPEKDHQQLIVDKLVKRHKKRKYRLYSDCFLNLNLTREVEEYLYDPSILHTLARNDEQGLLQALPLIGRRKNRRKNLSLKFVNSPVGKSGWFTIDSIVPDFGRIFEPIHHRLIQALPRILDRVFDELRLHELGISRGEFVTTFSS